MPCPLGRIEPALAFRHRGRRGEPRRDPRNFAHLQRRRARGAKQRAGGRYARLKLAGLEEAPCHLAVFADRATDPGHGLGRLTMPEMIEYSAVTAVHTIWLAARAQGIGMGWVSILDPAVAALLHVPAEWKFIGYFCLGYPQLEDTVPELEQMGWERRRPRIRHHSALTSGRGADLATIHRVPKQGTPWHLACSSRLEAWRVFGGGQIAADDRERETVLTSRPAEAFSALWPAAQIGTAILLSVVTWTPADAGNIAAENCVRTARSFNCVDNWGTSADPYVRVVPDAVGEAEKAQIASAITDGSPAAVR